MRYYLELPDETIARVDALMRADKDRGIEVTRVAMLRRLVGRGLDETERRRTPKGTP